MFKRRDVLKLGVLSSPWVCSLARADPVKGTTRAARATGSACPDLTPGSGGGIPLPNLGPPTPGESDEGFRLVSSFQRGNPTEESAVQFAPFQQPLRFPPIAQPASRDATTDFYAFTMRRGLQQVLPAGPQTEVWGYNGVWPGPTILARSNRTVTVRQTNALDVDTVVHLHGGVTPPESDGYPSDFIRPGTSRDYVYPLPQPAATLWYHDHAMDITGPNIYMGLAAFLLISDAAGDALGLPSGQFDVPLVLQDRIFDENNQLVFPPFEHDGVLGDTMCVNGVAQPFFRVARRKYRFRILNGSTARVYQLALSNGQPWLQIANDRGLMPTPVFRKSIFLSPAERVEVVVDFSAMPIGTSVVLENILQEAPRTRQLMRFDVTGIAVDPSVVPAQLRPAPRPAESEAVAVRDFVFERSHGAWVINGLLFEPHRVDARPRLNTVEIWRLINKGGGWEHPIHLHLVEFFILDRNGQPPAPNEIGPKDTVLLGPNEVVRIIMRWKGFTGQYVFHCHNAEHEDMRMMGTFEVVR